MVKGVERTDKQANIQSAKVQVKRELAVAKRNSWLILRSLWILMRKNRLLFWGGVVTFSVMLGAYLALVTPFLSDRTTLNPAQRSLRDTKLYKGNLSLNGLQYQVARPVNILVMGIEPVPGVKDSAPASFTGSSDTLLLLRLDPETKSLRVLSIPKDSQVVIPDIGLEKISLANSRGGAALAARAVSRSLNNIPIDRYIRLNPSGLRELVEQIGGVEVLVPQRMQYQDNSQKLAIDLQPGWQTLNGEQAEQFARFRNSPVGDLQRVQRQQTLLKALRDRLTSPVVLPHLPRLVHLMQSYIDTNLSLEEILALANFTVELQPENLQMVLLPGNLSPLSQDPSSYWLNSAGQDQVISQYFGVQATNSRRGRSLNSLRIAVQNASGKPEVGRRVTRYLQQQGFSNAYVISDWSDSQRQTEIIAQNGNLEAATELHKVIGLGKVEPSSTGDLESQLTVRVGKDWSSKQQPSEKQKNSSWQWGLGSREQRQMIND